MFFLPAPARFLWKLRTEWEPEIDDNKQLLEQHHFHRSLWRKEWSDMKPTPHLNEAVNSVRIHPSVSIVYPLECPESPWFDLVRHARRQNLRPKCLLYHSIHWLIHGEKECLFKRTFVVVSCRPPFNVEWWFLDKDKNDAEIEHRNTQIFDFFGISRDGDWHEALENI